MFVWGFFFQWRESHIFTVWSFEKSWRKLKKWDSFWLFCTPGAQIIKSRIKIEEKTKWKSDFYSHASFDTFEWYDQSCRLIFLLCSNMLVALYKQRILSCAWNWPPLSSFLPQWTSEPYESIDASNSNAAVTVKDDTQLSEQGCSQGLDKTQEDSASASTVPDPTDQKTVWERELICDSAHTHAHIQTGLYEELHTHK